MSSSRPRVAKTIPFGYKLCETDDKILDPVPKEQAVIEKAKEYYTTKAASIRELIAWVEENTGRRLTPRGFVKIMLRGW